MTPTPSREAFLASLLAFAAVPAGAQNSTTLRVGCAALDGFAEPYYAQELGFFETAGLDVAITRFNNGSQAVTAVASNAVDIGASTVTAVANAFLHGIPLTYIAGANLFDASDPDIGLCVAKDSPLRVPRDFEGRTIAVGGLKDGTDLALHAYLITNKVDVSNIHIIEMPFPEMAAALEHGTVDGAMIVEPFFTVALQNGARMFANAEAFVAPRLLAGGWFAQRSWAEQNADLVRRFVAVIYKTARWANANPAQSAAILTKISRITPDLAARMHRAVLAETLTVQLLQPQLTWAARLHFTDRLVAAKELIFSP